MSESPQEQTQTNYVSFFGKLAYGMGSLANNLFAAVSGGMAFILNIGYGMDPRLVGLVTSIPRLTDAITDPIVGYISDNTKSRWGRRRPFIFCGAILTGIVLMLLWQLPDDKGQSFLFWYFLGLSFVFFLAYTVFATPWVALGYELTPDTKERSVVMGVQNFIGQFAWLLAPWILQFVELDYFTDMKEGASTLAIVVGVVCACLGVIPAIFLRERFSSATLSEAVDEVVQRTRGLIATMLWEVGNFLESFIRTFANRNFLCLCFATFLVFNGFQLIGAFQLYVVTYYLFAGDTAAAAPLMGMVGTVGSISTFIVIAIATYLGRTIGKRKTFMVCIGISTVGYALKWLCYSQTNPWLILVPAPLISFGLGSLFTLMGAMIGDVCDLDEVKTGERREGMYGSIFWWVVKLGMSLALLLGGFLLVYTGFDESLGGDQSSEALFLMRVCDVFFPAFFSALAMLVMYFYNITEAKAVEARKILEERRGAL